MSRLADLHLHTYFSDGTSSPQKLIEDAQFEGLSCIAVTDHDTLEGIAPTLTLSKESGIEVIAGVELSTTTHDRDIHLLAYLFDLDNMEFNTKLQSMQEMRVERMQQMIEKLKSFGIEDISLDEICQMTQSKSVGRLHLAKLLVEKKHVANLKTAFEKYLAEDAAAYVPKYKISTKEAIDLIHQAKGIAVLAHPMVTGVDELIPQFVRDGLDGLEVYYPNTTETIREFYLGLAKKHDLLVTGGSDGHGEAKKSTWIGKVKIEYQLVEQLKEYHKKKYA